MPVEVAPFVNNLDTSNPPSGDPVAQGDDHIRLLKAVLKATFPDADKPFRFPKGVATAGNPTLTAVSQETVFLIDASGASKTVTLPSGLGADDEGWKVAVQKEDSSANAVSVVPASGTINGAASIVLSGQFDWCIAVWTGTGWTALLNVPSTLASLASRPFTPRVRAATTASITIATALNNGDTLDGVALVTGDLVLVKNQAAAAQNGIYVVGTSPARWEWMDTFNDHPGVPVFVISGTVNGQHYFTCNSALGGTLGSTAISYTEMTDLLDEFVGDSGSGGAKGLVPAPATNHGAQGRVLFADGNWNFPAVQQVLSVETAAVTLLSTLIPLDNTVPTSSEGTSILSRSITLHSSGNSVVVEGHIYVGADSNTADVCLAVFRGTTCILALVTRMQLVGCIPFSVVDTPGSVGAHTYSVRVGPGAGGFNLSTNAGGDGLTRVFGGAARCNMTLKEIH